MKKGADYPNFYENLEEAVFRLNQSVVLYDGEPVYIHSMENHRDGIVRVQITPLPLPQDGSMGAENIKRKMINSPKFNRFRPFELGNVNYLHGGIIYVYRIERIPARTRVQGTSGQNTQIVSLSDGRAGVNFANLLHNEGFVEMVKGIYPTWAEYVKAEIPSVALSRDIAVHRSETTGIIYLKYRHDNIGFVSDEGVVALFPKFTYLREAIEAENIFQKIKTDMFS